MATALFDISDQVRVGRERLLAFYAAHEQPRLADEAQALREHLAAIEGFETLAVARDILRRRSGRAA